MLTTLAIPRLFRRATHHLRHPDHQIALCGAAGFGIQSEAPVDKVCGRCLELQARL